VSPHAQHATSPFTVDTWEEAVYDDAPTAKLARTHLTKTFTGDVEGTSDAQILTVHNVDGPAAYVGIERVDASVHGRRGTFVLQHGASVVEGVPSLTITVVPGTGSGALEGLLGTATVTIDSEGKHTFELDYELP
jgi:Protein of unknown function (DUF3224)